MYTDMVGYTALGQRNESLSLALVEEQRKLIRPILTRHNGREIKTMGDAFLVEFPDALGAVRCAYDIQRATREFNISLPEDKRIHLRVGLHLGDVVEFGGDISGDAVNVASRIEKIAEDGGVCLSRQVYESTHSKFDAPLVSIGIKPLKNVSETIEVYTMEMPWGRAFEGEPSPSNRIAVLPFTNMSPDPNDEYFADGMTDEIISTVSRLGRVEVISRTSVMQYKKNPKPIREVSKELNVGTVLEGSVRKAGSKLRITTQMIDAKRDRHLWAETFDRNLEDVFAVQSEVAERVAGALQVSMHNTEQGESTADIEAYALYLRAMQLLHQITEPSLREAVSLFEAALSRDQKFVRAHSGLSMAWSALANYWAGDLASAVARAEAAASRAIELGPECAEAHVAMSSVHSLRDKNLEAVREAKGALGINPNLSDAYQQLGMAHASLGRLDEAVEDFSRARGLDPLSFSPLNCLAQVYRAAGMRDYAWIVLETLKELHPNHPLTYFQRAVWYREGKDFARAQESLDVGLRIFPGDHHLMTEQGVLYALTNRRQDAEKQLSRVMSHDEEKVRLHGAVFIQTALGNYDDAFKALMRQAEIHAWWWLMKSEPLFAGLTKDSRFSEFCRKVGIPS